MVLVCEPLMVLKRDASKIEPLSHSAGSTLLTPASYLAAAVGVSHNHVGPLAEVGAAGAPEGGSRG